MIYRCINKKPPPQGGRFIRWLEITDEYFWYFDSEGQSEHFDISQWYGNSNYEKTDLTLEEAKLIDAL